MNIIETLEKERNAAEEIFESAMEKACKKAVKAALKAVSLEYPDHTIEYSSCMGMCSVVFSDSLTVSIDGSSIVEDGELEVYLERLSLDVRCKATNPEEKIPYLVSVLNKALDSTGHYYHLGSLHYKNGICIHEAS